LGGLGAMRRLFYHDTQISSLPIYKAHIKTFVQYAAAEALVREITMQKLKQAAANKKKRSKKTIEMSVVCLKTWKIHQETQRVVKREKQKIIDDKRKTAAEKAAGKGKSKGKGKGKNKSKNNGQLVIKVPGEAIDSLFREDHEDDEIEAQLAAELEATTLNAATTITRSSRTRRAPVRYRQ
jgi:K+-sensing histidine kinase KdpD